MTTHTIPFASSSITVTLTAVDTSDFTMTLDGIVLDHLDQLLVDKTPAGTSIVFTCTPSGNFEFSSARLVGPSPAGETSIDGYTITRVDQSGTAVKKKQLKLTVKSESKAEAA